MECIECGSSYVITTMTDDVVRYGQGEDAAEIKVAIPVRRCLQCDSEWLDNECVRIQAEAVKMYLEEKGIADDEE